MEEDIKQIKEMGVEGVVVGCLDERGLLDHAILRRLLLAAEGMYVGFHRAIDASSNWRSVLFDLFHCFPQVRQVLSSGGQQTAWEGRNVLRSQRILSDCWFRCLSPRHPRVFPLSIVAAAGITPQIISPLFRHSNIDQFHGSFRSPLARSDRVDDETDNHVRMGVSDRGPLLVADQRLIEEASTLLSTLSL